MYITEGIAYCECEELEVDGLEAVGFKEADETGEAEGCVSLTAA